MYEQVEKTKDNKSRAVANSVAQNKSSSGKQSSVFLDNRIPQSTGRRGVLQRAELTSDYGTFEDKEYSLVNDTHINFELEFKPNAFVYSNQVALTQSVRQKHDGSITAIDPNVKNKQTLNGTSIDRLSEEINPLYAANGNAPLNNNPSHISHHAEEPYHGTYGKKVDNKWESNATLKDSPSVDNLRNSSRIFETVAIGIDETVPNPYLGSVEWGYESGNDAIPKLLPFRLISKGNPSNEFLEAANKWNNSRARGTLKVNQDRAILNNVTVNNQQIDDHLLLKGQKLTQIGTSLHGNDPNIQVEIIINNTNRVIGYVSVKDVNDLGDGKATIPLPIPQQQEQNLSGSLFLEDNNRQQNLPEGRLKLFEDSVFNGISNQQQEQNLSDSLFLEDNSRQQNLPQGRFKLFEDSVFNGISNQQQEQNLSGPLFLEDNSRQQNLPQGRFKLFEDSVFNGISNQQQKQNLSGSLFLEDNNRQQNLPQGRFKLFEDNVFNGISNQQQPNQQLLPQEQANNVVLNQQINNQDDSSMEEDIFFP